MNSSKIDSSDVLEHPQVTARQMVVSSFVIVDTPDSRTEAGNAVDDSRNFEKLHPLYFSPFRERSSSETRLTSLGQGIHWLWIPLH